MFRVSVSSAAGMESSDFHSAEMSGTMADSGQDPRDAPDLDLLWLRLDLTQKADEPAGIWSLTIGKNNGASFWQPHSGPFRAVVATHP